MRFKHRMKTGSVALAALLLIGGGFAMADNGSPHPANINPNKQPPVLDPLQLKPGVSLPITPSQLKSTATAWKAEDPNSRVICFRPDGSIAGGASLDRVDPLAPLTLEAAAALCERGYAGSRP